MKFRPVKQLLVLLGMLMLFSAYCNIAQAEIYLIASIKNPVDELELRQVRSLFKGRLTSVRDNPVIPMNSAPGSVDRAEFLKNLMGLSELDYTGYWHVRRYSGQGAPPTEINDHAELFERLKQDKDRVGYLWVPSGSKPRLPEGLKIIKLRQGGE